LRGAVRRRSSTPTPSGCVCRCGSPLAGLPVLVDRVVGRHRRPCTTETRDVVVPDLAGAGLLVAAREDNYLLSEPRVGRPTVEEELVAIPLDLVAPVADQQVLTIQGDEATVVE